MKMHKIYHIPLIRRFSFFHKGKRYIVYGWVPGMKKYVALKAPPKPETILIGKKTVNSNREA